MDEETYNLTLRGPPQPPKPVNQAASTMCCKCGGFGPFASKCSSFTTQQPVGFGLSVTSSMYVDSSIRHFVESRTAGMLTNTVPVEVQHTEHMLAHHPAPLSIIPNDFFTNLLICVFVSSNFRLKLNWEEASLTILYL